VRDQQIAAELGITPEKAARWRNRYLDGGIDALEKDAARPGRPRTIIEARSAEVIHKTTREKPFNATHWSTRTMAAAMGLSETTVRRIWHANGLKPHLVRTFKVGNDARFAEKLEVIVGLYLTRRNMPLCYAPMRKVRYRRWIARSPVYRSKKGWRSRSFGAAGLLAERALVVKGVQLESAVYPIPIFGRKGYDAPLATAHLEMEANGPSGVRPTRPMLWSRISTTRKRLIGCGERNRKR
jgi:transposase